MAMKIAHPLEAKVDRIIRLNLGERETWKVDQKILASRFDPIRNKDYVTKRMAVLGFIPTDDLSAYKYIGARNYAIKPPSVKPLKKQLKKPEPRNRRVFMTPKRINQRKDWVAKEVLKVSPRLRGLLRHLLLFDYVSIGHLDKANRKRVSDMVAALRKESYQINTSRNWNEKIGTNVTTYKLKTSDNCELSEAC